MGKNHLLLDGTIIVMLVNVLSNKQQQLKHLKRMIVQFPIGLETIIVMMKTTLLDVDLMVEIVVIMTMMAGTIIAQNVHVLRCQKQLRHQRMIVQFPIGLETIIVMMKITLLDVDLMVEIVAKNHQLMDGTTIAQTENVLNFQQQLKPLMDQIVLLLIGLVIIIVMMKTTMLNVALMVEIVVGMSTHNIALLVNVSNNSCQKNLITIHKNKEKHAQL